jgi:hypothetical protein
MLRTPILRGARIGARNVVLDGAFRRYHTYLNATRTRSEGSGTFKCWATVLSLPIASAGIGTSGDHVYEVVKP